MVRTTRTLATGKTVEAIEDLSEKAYTEEELKKLLIAAEQTKCKKHHNENYLVIGIAAYCSCRTRELLGIHPEDIDIENRILSIYTLKQRKVKSWLIRKVPIPELLVFRIRTFIDGMDPKQPIFKWYPDVMRGRIKHICKIANVKYRGIKGLRHRFGTYFGPSYQPHELAALMGHSGLHTIMVYFHQRPEQIMERYDEAVNGEVFNIKKKLPKPSMVSTR